MLQETETKTRKKKTYFKYSIAACFLLMLFIFWFFTQNQSPKLPTHEVVIDVLPSTNLKNETKIESNYQKTNDVVLETKKPIKPNQIIQAKITINAIETKEITANDITIKDLKIENAIENEPKTAFENTEFLVATEKSQPINIDAALLLQAAEKDLDFEHRDKTLLKLKNSFNQIKTYVNNINYQKN